MHTSILPIAREHRARLKRVRTAGRASVRYPRWTPEYSLLLDRWIVAKEART
jgi:hypothetical protein